VSISAQKGATMGMSKMGNPVEAKPENKSSKERFPLLLINTLLKRVPNRLKLNDRS